MVQPAIPSQNFSPADDQMRVMVRVARMYHEQSVNQAEISRRLHISQARVSRLLKRAGQVGIVKTIVSPPSGVYAEVEEALEAKYGLVESVVVDTDYSASHLTSALGVAAAEYLSTTLIGNDIIGISSWSASLLAAVTAMKPFNTQVAQRVVQLVGGLGNQMVQVQATNLIGRLAAHTGAEPLLLPTPGVLGSRQAKATLMEDSTVTEVIETWQNLTVALVGIGAIEPSELARQSGNAFPDADRDILKELGAVGDVCFRFFDADGVLIESEFDARVIGIDPQELKVVPRRIAVAGGPDKVSAIQGALIGDWVNVLVTDLRTAQQLIQ